MIISNFGGYPAYWDIGAWNVPNWILQARKSWRGWNDKWATRQTTLFPLKVCWSSSGTGCPLQVDYRTVESQGSTSQEMGTRKCAVVAEKKIRIPVDCHILFIISSFLSAWKNEKMVCKYAEDLRLGKDFVPAGGCLARSEMQALKTAPGVWEQKRGWGLLLSVWVNEFSACWLFPVCMSFLISGLFPVESLSAFPCFYCSHCPCI